MNDINRLSELSIAAKQKTKERDYWLDQLSGDLIKSVFPYDFNGNAGKGSVVETIKFKLPGDTCKRAKKLSNDSDLRLHILFAASITVLLEKYTGNTDIIVGVPIYKQESRGHLINTALAVRNRLEDIKTFKQLILQMSKAVFEAAEYQNYPIQVLVEQLNMTSPDSNYADFPLFDTAVLIENIHDRRDIAHIPVNMIFSFSRTGEEIEGKVEYNSLRYQKHSAGRIIEHLKRLMEIAFFNVDIPLTDIQILTEEEKNRLLIEFNDTKAQFPAGKTVVELFEEQVDKYPERIAVTGADRISLKYRQLNEKANRLARVSRKKGIVEESIVAVVAERSLPGVVAMMAVLKAGAAYLPISSFDPPGRKKFLLEDTGADLLLIQKGLFEKDNDTFGRFPSHRIVFIDDDSIYKGEEPGTNLELAVKPDRAAYVVFPGNIRRPDGAMIEHSSLLNFIYSVYRSYDHNFGPKDRCLSLMDISIDVNICEIFLPLLVGAAAVLMPAAQLADPGSLAKTIVNKFITFAFIPPALLKDVLESLKDYRSRVVLDKVMTGGESVDQRVLEEYLEFDDKLRLVVAYGPVGTAIAAAFYPVPPGPIPGLNSPIGKPANNTEILLLHKRRHLCPPGASGDIYISGAALGRGYLNRPELTAEKFVPNPFFPGIHMFETGDTGRWSGEGALDFLGSKLDMRQLPGAQPGEQPDYVAPRDEIEKSIAAVWKEVLNRDEVGINDNFFEAGGNSLGLLKVKNRLKETLGREIPDIKFLEYPTIGSLSEYLNREVLNPAGSAREANNAPLEVENMGADKLKLRSRILEEEEVV